MGEDLVVRDFLTDSALVADPYQFYDASGGARCGVSRTMASCWSLATTRCLASVVTSGRACRRATWSAGRFRGCRSVPEGDDISDLIERFRDTLPISDYFASFDPPKHTYHRALLARLLTPKRLKENEEFLWRLADRTIDSFVDGGRCEFVRDFGTPFTMLAIADLLGVPEVDHGRFHRAPELVGDIEGTSGRPHRRL